MLLKEKVAAKLALEKEKERQRSEEQKKLQEKRKEQAEALAQRKLQEHKLAEKLKKQEHLEREMEKHYIRTMPLGKDRFHNRFWFFFREGRLFVESDDCKRWGYYSAKEEVTTFQVSVAQNIPLILLILLLSSLVHDFFLFAFSAQFSTSILCMCSWMPYSTP
jgi:hypothetical protein